MISNNTNQSIADKITKLKKEKNAAVLSHFYQNMDVQNVADIVGDSHELAKKASSLNCDIIVLCGVRFMAESAKILNPSKKVLLPAYNAGCPMADMISPEDIEKLKAAHPDAAVVCYVNSTAATKAKCDICCTSSNAVRVVKSLPNKKIIFVPDQNLGHHVAAQVPEKEFIFYDGFCPIHRQITADDIKNARAAYPNAKIAVHPECLPEVVSLSDFAGSTSQIIDYIANSNDDSFIIGTEKGVVDRMKNMYQNKKIEILSPCLVCENMKKTDLSMVLDVLENETNEIIMSEEEIKNAYAPLKRMISV